jgi:hypothetical protein
MIKHLKYVSHFVYDQLGYNLFCPMHVIMKRYALNVNITMDSYIGHHRIWVFIYFKNFSIDKKGTRL